MQMKAVVYDSHGEADVLHLRDVPKPAPLGTELLVKVHAVGINRADILQRKGFYPPPADASPILGLELSGTVVEVGAEVSQFQVGDPVCGLVTGGAYAEYCILEEALAIKHYDGMDHATAAAMVEAGWVANETLFHLGQLKCDERVLIHAGGSGVGSMAIQMAHLRGAQVATTAGSQAKLERCRELGANLCIPYKETNFLDEILNWHEPGGVDLILDFIGAAYLDDNLKALRQQGRIILIGFLGGVRSQIDLRQILARRLCIKGFVLRSQNLDEKAAVRARFERTWRDSLEAGSLKTVIYEKIPVEKVCEAHKMMEASEHFGKIILEFQV